MLFATIYLERILYLEPCPLCVIDRIILVCMAAFFLLAALHNPARPGQQLYNAVTLLLAGTGVAVAKRHIWLQHLPPDKVPECGASLSYMLETLALSQTLGNVLQGSGECAEIQWTFLGLSIPEQTLLLFIGLAGLSLLQLLRKTENPKTTILPTCHD